MGALAIAGAGGCSGIVQRVGATAPEWFEVEVTTTAANQTYSWQISAGTAINAETQWGDGTNQTHTAAGIYTKTYANAGVYTLRLKASFGANGAFNMRPSADRVRLTRLLSPIPAFPGLTSVSQIAANCSGLSGSIPADFLRYVADVTNLSGLLANTNLSGPLPADFLRYVPGVTNLSSALQSCPLLTGDVSADLLRYVINCNNFNGFLANSTRLRLRADIFGPDPNIFLNRSIDFSSAFRNLGTTSGTPQGTAPTLWLYNFGTGTPTTTNAFGFNNATSLSNWAQIPIAWGGPA